MIEPHLFIFAFQNYIYKYTQHRATGGSWSITTAVVKICHRHSPRGNSDFAMTIWRFWISDCKYVLLLVQVRGFARRVCVCVRERERDRVTVESAVLIVACLLQTHTSIITVSVTWLCSPLGLELMVKLRTLLTVFTFILKDEARDYRKGRYIFDECLWCSANHNALRQLANQSRLCLSEGGTL